jgi:hypothetical protein
VTVCGKGHEKDSACCCRGLTEKRTALVTWCLLHGTACCAVWVTRMKMKDRCKQKQEVKPSGSFSSDTHHDGQPALLGSSTSLSGFWFLGHNAGLPRPITCTGEWGSPKPVSCETFGVSGWANDV